jgi:hypothetical protein
MSAILDRALGEYQDFDESVRHVAAILTMELKNYFTELKKYSRAVFNHFQTYSYGGGEIIIAGRVNKMPTAYLLDYKIVDGSEINVIMKTGKTAIKEIRGSDECFWRAIGNTAFPDNKMPTEKEMAASPAKKAKWIIEEGIKTYPAFVGKPVRILEMTESGDEWIE